MATIIVTILRETEIETERVNGLVVYISLINFFASRFSIKLFSKLDIERRPKIFPFFHQTRNSIRYFFFFKRIKQTYRLWIQKSMKESEKELV